MRVLFLTAAKSTDITIYTNAQRTQHRSGADPTVSQRRPQAFFALTSTLMIAYSYRRSAEEKNMCSVRIESDALRARLRACRVLGVSQLAFKVTLRRRDESTQTANSARSVACLFAPHSRVSPRTQLSTRLHNVIRQWRMRTTMLRQWH
jgi:hypothetical protein